MHESIENKQGSIKLNKKSEPIALKHGGVTLI